MKVFTSLAFILAALCVAYACNQFSNCISCTNQSDRCIFIGIEDNYLCIRKIDASQHDFDYLSELPSDCDFDDGKQKLIHKLYYKNYKS